MKFLGQLALKLGLGGSRKDALTNVSGWGVLALGLLEATIRSGLLPTQYEGAALSAISVLVALGFGASGKSANLDRAE
jgi:hypothetical protein